MAAQTDLTVKKNDGTTDITYTKVVPSAGEGIPAVWRSMSVGNAVSHQPELRVLSKDSKPGYRLVRGTFRYPSIALNTTTGVYQEVGFASGRVEFDLPKAMLNTDKDEAASQFLNLFSGTIAKTWLKEGLAPT